MLTFDLDTSKTQDYIETTNEMAWREERERIAQWEKDMQKQEEKSKTA